MHSKLEAGRSEANLNFIFGLVVFSGGSVVIVAIGGRTGPGGGAGAGGVGGDGP